MAKKLSSLDGKLLAATKKSQLEEVVALLSEGANPNAKQNRASALDLVSPLAHELKATLIEAGARQNSLKKDLVWAASRANPEVVKLLIDYGADINLNTPIGTPIMAALERGCSETVRLLLQAGCDLLQTTTMSTPLTKAIKAQQVDLLQEILKAGCPVNITSAPGGPTALFSAVEHQSLDAAKCLLEAGADPNSKAALVVTGDFFSGKIEQHRDFYPLHYAAHSGLNDMAELLLKHGAQPTLKDGSGHIASYWAAQQGHTVLAKILEPDEPTDTPTELLLQACSTGDIRLFERALADGATVQTRDCRTTTKNFTTLQLAVANGHSGLARKLISLGADPNAHEQGDKIPGYLLGNVDDTEQILQMGYSLNRAPLNLALLGGFFDLALELLAAGADPGTVSALGETPVHLAAAKDCLNVLVALNEREVKLDKAGPGKCTPLMEACRTQAIDAAKYLLKNKAKPNRKNRDGESPLYIACSKCSLELTQLLLSNGANPNFEGEFGTPLVAAAGASRVVPHTGGPGYISVSWGKDGATTYEPYPEDDILPLVQLLLDAGAEPNVAKGTTPLGAAAQAGHLKVVQLLIEAGARKGAKDFVGCTPMELAKLFKRDAVVEYLRNTKEAKSFKAGKSKKKTDGSKKASKRQSKPTFAPTPRFKSKIKSKAFKTTLLELAEICNSKPVTLEHHCEIHVATEHQSKIDLLELQAEFLKRNTFLFDRTGSHSTAVKLGIIPSVRWQDAIAVLQSNGINYDIGSQDIIDWFEQWAEDNPFRILGISEDIVSGQFTRKIRKPKLLTKSIYELCPDTVEQGLGSLEELEDNLKNTRQFFFWWD